MTSEGRPSTIDDARDLHDLTPRQLAGQLLVIGFDGERLPAWASELLARGECAGVILFRRNLPSLEAAAEIARAVRASAPATLPPFVSVDQEGGRVTRLPSPFPTLPAARRLGDLGEPGVAERAGELVGTALAHLGFNLNFAPVLDVDTNPANPVIGDRSFSRSPAAVSALAVAFARGQRRGGVMSCGKHFPGHGDTDRDSHLALPSVPHDLARMNAVELRPFRAAVAARFEALMTAHVVFPALDPTVPATLSRAVVTGLLREELGFEGVVFSDDLEMRAVADHASPDRIAIAAVEAGVDALLSCRERARVEQALDALHGAQRDPHFAARARASVARSLALRRGWPVRPLDPAAVTNLAASDDARALAELLAP